MVREQLSIIISSIITALLVLVALLTPLLFAPFTTEYFEAPKLIFLVSITLVLLLLWSLSWVLKGKVVISRTPLDIPILLLLGIVVLSSIFSDSKDISLYGNLPRIHGSAASWICYILLYFVAVSNIRTKFQIKSVILGLLGSAVVISLISLAAYFNVYLFGQNLAFTRSVNFTPTGSSFSAAALLLLVLPLTLLAIVTRNKLLPLPFAIILSSLFTVTLVLIGTLPLYLVALLTLGLVLLVNKRSFPMDKNELLSSASNLSQKSLPLLLIPVVIALLTVALSYLPIPGQLGALGDKRVNFPHEIQLPLSTSWKISASSFRDHPFLGSGPATYLFDFTQYKPIEHNSTPYWNIRFDVSFNEFLQTFATLGLLGLVALIFLGMVVIVFAWRGLNNEDLLSSYLSIATIIAVVLLLFHVTTVVSAVLLFIILALLMAIHKYTGKVEELSLGIKTSRLTDSSLVTGDVLPLILFIPIVAFVGFAGWNLKNMVLADVHHRNALNMASTRALDTYNELIKAEQLNPRIDLYRTDLAQTNFALANAIAFQKGPTDASPSGSLTDQDKQNIQQLLSQSINEGKAAVTLSPRNAQNWEILASIYRQISGVAQNALQFSLDSYGRAIQLDPLNPLLRLNVGGVYYSVKNYDLAIRFFSDAVNLKPDFANGYYNLSVALRDKGDLQGAQAAAERVVSLLDPKSANYKTASDYLADLKARIATGSAQQSQITPPAAEQNGALQNENLPDVGLGLEAPEKITTPSAVPTPKPTPTPSPTASPEASASPAGGG